ncbi:hypothetical protein FQZ97_757840 [compost metagenome]
MPLHFPYHLHQLLVVHIEAAGDLHALVVLLGADAPQHELLGHLQRQGFAMAAADQGEHQVEAGGAAGAGDAPAVDLEQLLGGVEPRVALLEGFDGFPVQGQALPGKEFGLGQHEAAGVDAAQQQALALRAVQPVGQARTEAGERLEAGHHEQAIPLGRRIQPAVHVQRHAVAAGHRSAVQAEQAPAIELAAKAIGHPQWLHRRHQADHGKTRQQEEAERLGHGAFREWDKALKDTGPASARKVVVPVQQVVVLVRIGGFAAA